MIIGLYPTMVCVSYIFSKKISLKCQTPTAGSPTQSHASLPYTVSKPISACCEVTHRLVWTFATAPFEMHLSGPCLIQTLIAVKGVISAKMVKIIKFLFFAQKVSSGMGALRPKFLGG